MPTSITKSALSEETVDILVQKAFGVHALEIEELKEGFFNAAYRIRLADKAVVLKIAPPKEIDVMTHEKNIMFSEVDSMKMAAQKTAVPIPGIYFYDNSHILLDRDYFFMEMLEGKSLSSLGELLSEEEKKNIYFHIGSYTKQLNQIEGEKFGYYAQPDKQGECWYEVFRSMLMDVCHDAGRKNIVLPVEEEKILEMLEKDGHYFATVKTPEFVHWDIWEGNVFIHNGKISGIIDFERCLWADPLMEVGFRTYHCEPSFFEGYGIMKLHEEEKRRARWYDLYLFLIQCLEGDYRGYKDRGLYDWSKDMLLRCMEDLN